MKPARVAGRRANVLLALGLLESALVASTRARAETAAGEQAASRPSAVATEPLGAAVLIRQRSVRLRVEDVEASIERVLGLVRDQGGQLEQRAGQKLTLRVPEQGVTPLLARLPALGELRAQSASTVDESFRAADLEAAVRAAEQTRAMLTALLARARNVEESLLVERRIKEMETRIANARAERRALDRRRQSVALVIELEALTPEALPSVELPFDWLKKLSFTELMYPSAPPYEEESGLESNVDIALALEGRLIRDRPSLDENSRALAAALRMRGADVDPVGFAAGFDAALGGFDGFVYDLRFLAGLGTAFGRVVTLGLVGGLGFSGWTGDRVPSSLELPLELFMFVDLDEFARLAAYAQPRFAVTREARRDGSKLAGPADEISIGGAVLLPLLLGNERLEHGGMRLGFEYGQLLDTTAYLVTLGVGFGFPNE